MAQAVNESKNKKRRALGWVFLLLAALCLLIGAVLAKYVSSDRRKAEMLSADFHFSSDYLEYVGESGEVPEYGVFDMSSLGFQLYNYEKTNLCLVAKGAIKYRVTVPDGWSVTVKSGGTEVQPDGDGCYEMPCSDERECWDVSLTPQSDSPALPVEVTVKTVSPYELVLKAKFTQAGSAPRYTVSDKGNYRLVEIKSNNYAGDISLNWAADDLSPDNTNPLMKNWTDSAVGDGGMATGTFTAEKNHVYRLIFVEKQAATQSGENAGAGSEITID